VDLSGRVVGINSRATFLANNLGFAIPINIVKEVTGAILTEGSVTRSWIGIHAQALQELESHFGTERNNGVLVSSIDAGSPAEESYLQAGDVVLAIDSEPVSARFVEELPAFYKKIASRPPGSEIELNVLREEEEYTFKITTKLLGELQGEDFESAEWGFTIKAITRQMQISNRLIDTLGVLVIGVKRLGAADLGGLRRGDVVQSINKRPVDNLADFVALYNENTAGGAAKTLLTVRRGAAVRMVVLNPNRGEDREAGAGDE
jgi:S1-C subfamily serine protease